jgi:hypothetical protein
LIFIKGDFLPSVGLWTTLRQQELVCTHQACGCAHQPLAQTSNSWTQWRGRMAEGLAHPGMEHVKLALVVKSAVLELLESFPDQPLKFLRLSGVILHLLLSETGLKCRNLLEILCLGDLFDQRER